MAQVSEIVRYADGLLNAGAYKDYCPNGLQVQGKHEVAQLISAVTASRAAIESAIEAGADALLVHHGLFWNGDGMSVTGMKRDRLAGLLRHDINLIAYHLPLDAHAEHGNNVRFAAMCGLTPRGRFGPENICCHGETGSPLSAAELGTALESAMDRPVLHVAGGPERIHRVGWCTGAGQNFIQQAAEMSLDAYISGEISEQTTHIARECGIHYYMVGHHASERYGVQSLGAHLARQFGIVHRFIDIPNPA